MATAGSSDAAPAAPGAARSEAPEGRRGGGRRGLIVAAVVIAAAWLAPLGRAWSSSADLGHGWAVPLLIAYLWWERWGERPPPVARGPLAAGWWWALPVLLAADLVLRLLLAPFPLWPAALLADTLLLAAVALAGAWLLAGRSGVRWLGPPLVLLASALPLPSSVGPAVIQPLREGLAALAAEISNALWRPAIAFGTTVRIGSTDIGIDEACGGIRSLQACCLVGLFFGEWYRFGWGRRAALVAAGIAAAVLGNFGRVLFLAARAGGGAGAVAAVHDRAGWVAMIASLLLTGGLAWRWGGYRGPPVRRGAPRAASPPGPAWHWLAAAAAILALDQGAVLAWYGRAAAAQAGRPQWTVQLPAEAGTFRTVPLDEPARELLRPDGYTAGEWRSAGDFPVSAYYIEWRRGQAARYVPFLHNPTVCLPLAGCELLGAEPDLAVDWAGGRIPFRCYRFSRMGGELFVAFVVWDPARGAPLAAAVEEPGLGAYWRRQWREVREARENQPGQLLSVSIPWRPGSREAMQSLLGQLVTALPRG